MAEWFKYPMGSRLLFFWFPTKYHTQAMSGVRVCYIKEGPTSKRPLPPLGNNKRAVLALKIKKFVTKGYIALVKGQIGSLIKYFAVPKEIINGIVQDWRTVFHAGANKLNDCVWTPSFSLPTINFLLQIVDKHRVMANRDMGKMFLNFNLHLKTTKFACINIEPLGLPKKEYPHCWMHWT